MKSGIIRHMLTYLLILPALAGCKKEGTQGPPGPAGNANVKGDTIRLINSNWLYPGQWALQTGGGAITYYSTRYADIATDLITADIIKRGSVEVFFKPNNDSWTNLPYSFLGAFPAINHHFMYEFKAGNIRLHYYWSAGPTTPVPTGLNTYVIPGFTFKYVVTAGN
ncbi:hypothetical protein [Paraflavitalea speifideaquila]|uniref:hypothetical protein n=1 Tax=Paraflavitalea speifideaquila TaxID=3076558 RepID=UPI0028E1BA0D|nr:hypothetical protein [Paraflavitalea speifideiaquila]